tara:strand:- start:816 stop:965 length:150 start_codon:yes stop_codon:yes gene_type:complete
MKEKLENLKNQQAQAKELFIKLQGAIELLEAMMEEEKKDEKKDEQKSKK